MNGVGCISLTTDKRQWVLMCADLAQEMLLPRTEMSSKTLGSISVLSAVERKKKYKVRLNFCQI